MRFIFVFLNYPRDLPSFRVNFFIVLHTAYCTANYMIRLSGCKGFLPGDFRVTRGFMSHLRVIQWDVAISESDNEMSRSQSQTMRCRERSEAQRSESQRSESQRSESQRSEAYTNKCLNEAKGNIASESDAYWTNPSPLFTNPSPPVIYLNFLKITTAAITITMAAITIITAGEIETGWEELSSPFTSFTSFADFTVIVILMISYKFVIYRILISGCLNGRRKTGIQVGKHNMSKNHTNCRYFEKELKKFELLNFCNLLFYI